MLEEQDARNLSRHIVGRLRALGVFPTQFGVALHPEGFSFTADINGRSITVQTGQGNFEYETIAKEFWLRSLMVDEWGDRVYKIEEPGKLPTFNIDERIPDGENRKSPILRD